MNAYWLRPESALWDCIAAKNLKEVIKKRTDIVELGIGNGFFTFLLLGGKFDPSFDWFFSVNTKGFWQNKDIFDYDSNLNIQKYIKKYPRFQLSLAVDHKQNLLNQAAKLGVSKKLIKENCNKKLPIGKKYHTVYSNIVYWLKDPFKIINNIGEILNKNGMLVLVFPNKKFYKYCISYKKKNNLWSLINRGRAKHILWHMNIGEFKKKIHKTGVFQVKYSRKFLAPSILKIWDIGLRPLSVPLIKMANSLSPEVRKTIKREWCYSIKKLIIPLLSEEISQGNRKGGFNLVVLKKISR